MTRHEERGIRHGTGVLGGLRTLRGVAIVSKSKSPKNSVNAHGDETAS